MRAVELTARGLSKDFNRRSVFRGVSFSLSRGDSLAITGRNGSGKSTLSKIIAGVLTPTNGTIEFTVDGHRLDQDTWKDYLGFVSPYLNLYEEFTAAENLEIVSHIRGNGVNAGQRVEELLKFTQLWSRRHDLVGEFSSGMKQRLKYAFALLHDPLLLILDEPTATLDEEGIKLVRKIIEKQKKEGILIVATNDKVEAKWCKKRIFLEGSGSWAIGGTP